MRVTLCASALLLAVAGCRQPARPAGGNVPAGPTVAASAPPPGATGASGNSPAVTLAAAKAQIEATIASQPNVYDLRIRGAEFLMRAGEHAAAIPHLQAAARLRPKELLPWLALGDAATFTRRTALAETSYARAEKVSPGHPLVTRGRGQLLVSQRRFADAKRLLEAGLKRHPRDLEIRTALGNLLLVLNKPRPAIKVMLPALQANPDRADLHYMLADAYERDLKLEAAIESLREAVRLEPTMDQAHGRMGLYLVNLTRYEEARAPLERAIELNPQQSHYYWALGDSYLLDSRDPQNYERAVELYRKSLELDPKNPKTLYSYAMALTRRGSPAELEEAVLLFKRLLALNAEDMNAHYKLAETYRRLRRPTDARAHMTRFKVLFEKGRRQNKDLYTSVAYRDTAAVLVKRGQDQLRQRRFRDAASSFRLALEREPRLAEARKGLREAEARIPAADRSGG